MPTEAPSEPVQGPYEPKAPLSRATTAGLQAGAVGAFVSAVQNALASHSAGAAGFLTRTGGSIGTFGGSPRHHYLSYFFELCLNSGNGRYLCVHRGGGRKSA